MRNCSRHQIGKVDFNCCRSYGQGFRLILKACQKRCSIFDVSKTKANEDFQMPCNILVFPVTLKVEVCFCKIRYPFNIKFQ